MRKVSVSTLFLKSAVASVMLLSVAFGFLASKVSAQALPPAVTAYSSITVKVNGVSYKTLYDFTTDLTNDELWFPNVEETVVVNGPTNPYTKKGTKYIQRSFFNGIQLDTEAVVTRDLPKVYYELKGVGPVASYDAYYTFLPTRNGGSFTLTTKFVSPGITEESLTFLLETAMQNILDYYNTTGSIRLNYLHIVE